MLFNLAAFSKLKAGFSINSEAKMIIGISVPPGKKPNTALTFERLREL
ncbi:MAG: hypothetical protein ABSE95_14085 [Thermodesulfobacteriota bacterium]|jgi:hypothetical protein